MSVKLLLLIFIDRELEMMNKNEERKRKLIREEDEALERRIAREKGK